MSLGQNLNGTVKIKEGRGLPLPRVKMGLLGNSLWNLETWEADIRRIDSCHRSNSWIMTKQSVKCGWDGVGIPGNQLLT